MHVQGNLEVEHIYMIFEGGGGDGYCGTEIIRFIPYMHLDFFSQDMCTVCILFSLCSMHFFLLTEHVRICFRQQL